MKLSIRVTFAVVFALAVFSAYAQASRFVGSWTVDVQGSPRQRAMVITQEGDTLQVSWGWKDQAKLPAVESSLDGDGTLTITTRTDAVIVVHISDDDTLRGKFTTSAGKVLSATAIRSTGAAQTSAPQLAAATPVSNTSQAAMPMLSPGQTFADETKDFGVSPTKFRKGPPYDVGTPMQAPGVRTVTTVELREMMAGAPAPILIDANGSAEMIESANGMGSGIGEQRVFSKDRDGFTKAMERLTGGDRGRMVVFYCRGSSCWHSYNASLYALEAGYSNVVWYRGGIDAWRAAGGKTVPFKHVADW
jgi:rhodanese-related sulfurtransferase